MPARRIASLMFLPIGVLVLAMALWLLVPTFVSTDFVRNAIQNEITETAGRRVSLGSTTEIRLFPRPSARLNDVKVYPPTHPGTPGEPVMEAKSIDVQMTLGSLFTGQPIATSVTLNAPIFRIDTQAEGGLIGQLPLGHIAEAVMAGRAQRATGAAAQSVEQPAGTLVLPAELWTGPGTVAFRDAQFEFLQRNDDGSMSEPLVLTRADGRLVWPRLDAPLTVTGRFVHRGVALDLRLTSASPIDALGGTISGMTASLESALLSFNFEGVAGFSAGFYAKGTVDFATPSLRRMLLWRGNALRPALALGDTALSAQIQARGKSVRLDAMNVTIDGNSGTGVVEITEPDNAPLTIIGTVDFETLDLRGVLSAFTNVPQQPAARTAIDTRFMDQIQTDLRLSARRADFAGIALTNVAATAQTTPTIALFDIGDATAFGGTIQSRLQLERKPDQQRSAFVIAGQGVSSSALRDAVALPATLPTGNADFSLSLTSDAPHWSELMVSGDGMLMMRMESGTVPGIDPAMLDTLGPLTSFQPLDLAKAGVSFNRMAFETSVSDGIVDLNGIELAYGERRLRLNGYTGLDGKSLAAGFRLLDETGKAASRNYLLAGSLDKPYILAAGDAPDIGAIVPQQ